MTGLPHAVSESRDCLTVIYIRRTALHCLNLNQCKVDCLNRRNPVKV
jgi:hypothetical protein